MIDLHSHTFLSDGCLIPSELARRAEEKGIRILAITDHVDFSNYDFVIDRIKSVVTRLNAQPQLRIKLIAGAEITHVPPSDIAELTRLLREKGAGIIGVHGETITEPVAKGTNRAAIEAGVDFLAHPGLIDDADVKAAAEKGVFLEITSRRGHSITNGHVAGSALLHGAKLIINTDSHAPGDLITRTEAEKVLRGAGLSPSDVETTFSHSEQLASCCIKRSA